MTFVFLIHAALRPLLRPYLYSDFSTFYSAAEAFAHGQNPYDFETLQSTGSDDFPGWIGRYFYPPPFAASLIRPLTWLPFEAARRVWVMLELAAYMTALFSLARFLLGRGTYWNLALPALLGFSFAPVFLDLKLGSVTGVLLLFLVMFLRAYHASKLPVGCLWLAGAIVLKLSPALLLVLFVLRREWNWFLGTLGSALLIVVVCLPFSGWNAYLHYVNQVLPELMTGNFSWFTNQSIDAFFWRLFVANPDTTPWIESPVLYRACSWGMAAIVLSFWVKRALRHRPEADVRESMWLFAWTLVTALLLARVTWEYMCVLTLPLFLLWLREILRGAPETWRVIGIALAYAAVATPFPYTQEPLRQGAGILLEAPRFYGMLILWGLSGGYRPQTGTTVRGRPLSAGVQGVA